MPFVCAGGAGTNPFTIYDQTNIGSPGTIVAGNSSTGGRTLTSTALSSGETTLIKLIIGDSTGANSGVSLYAPTNAAKNENFNSYNGLVYRFTDPYLGASGGAGSYPGRTADKLITAAKFARVITMGVCYGGAGSPDYAKTGSLNHHIVSALMYARSYGWPVSGSADTWRMAVVLQLGINDVNQGVSAANFSLNAASIFQTLRDYGFLGKIFVAKTTMLTNVVNSAMQAAQVALVNNPNGIYAGADHDSLTGSNKQGDGTHFSDVGNDALGGLWQAIFTASY